MRLYEHYITTTDIVNKYGRPIDVEILYYDDEGFVQKWELWSETANAFVEQNLNSFAKTWPLKYEELESIAAEANAERLREMAICMDPPDDGDAA